MLVAAGFGTRLDPLTRELPKPALPVANRPIAWFACDHLARSGFDDIVANTHHLAVELRRALEPHCPPRVQLRFEHEPVILGTGGGVRHAWRPQPGEDFVVVNAKLLFAPDLGHALAVHRERGAIATMVLRTLPAGATFTGVEVDDEGYVARIGGKPARSARAAQDTRLMYTGVQILNERAWRDLPESGDIIAGSYWPWLERGERVCAVIDDSPWVDIGVTVERYLEANLALASGALTWPGIAPAAGAVIAAPDATLGAGARLEQACIGSGATIGPGVRVQRAVVWEGARVRHDLQNAIVTTAGTIVQL